MQAINYTECYVVQRLAGLAQFCRIQPKRLYVINTCICNVVEAVEVEAKLHITVACMPRWGLFSSNLIKSNKDG